VIVERSALAAHEFFHAAQWRYQQACPRLDPLPFTWAWFFNEDLRWWMEATATWAQQEAIQGDTSYAAYIPNHLNESWRRMDTRNQFNLPPFPSDNAIAYSTLFPFYLIEKLQPGQINKDIIRQTWAQYQQTGNCGPMKPVIDSILPQGQKMSNIFPNFAEANYFLAYPAPPDIRGALQARNWPQDIRPAHDPANLSEQTLAVAGPNNPPYGGTYIEPLGAAYVEFTNNFGPSQKDKGRSLRVTVNIPTSNLPIPPVVKVWTITQFPVPPNSAPIVAPIQLSYQNGAYTGVVTISNFDASQVLRVGMVVTNPQTSGSSFSNWNYQAQIIAPTPTPTSTPSFTPAPSATSTPTP